MSTCKSCGARIIFVKTTTGSSMPLNAGMADNGNVVIEGDPPIARVVAAGAGMFISHFATCPGADAHRKKKEPPPPHWSDK
jgi:hypothetical protein